MKKRIALLADPIDDQNSGVHVYTRNWVEGLLQQSEFEWVIVKQYPEEWDVEQYAIPKKNHPLWDSPRMFYTVPRLLNSLNLDAVIEPAHFGPWNLKPSIQRVTIIHDLTPINLPEFHRFHSSLLQQLFLRKILERADGIVTNSRSTTADVVEFLPSIESKVKHIYPGVSQRIQEQRGRIENRPYFLVVGSIEPRKNGVRILKAFEKLAGSNPSLQLIFVGDPGWNNQSFHQELAKNHYKDQIQLKGFVSETELSSYYQHAEALLYPSIYEGFGFPVLEGFSAQTLVVTSHRSSTQEIASDAAFLVDPLSVESLQNAMEQVVHLSVEERECRIKKGIDHAQQFTWSRFTQQWMAYLKDLTSD